MTSTTNNEIYCPSCQKPCDAAVDTCPSCGWRSNRMVGRQGPSIVRPAVRPKLQCEVDLATTVDRTGSSECFQTGIPKTFEMIVSQVGAKARSVKCWLQSHGDLDEGQKSIIHTDGGTPDQAIKDIKKISYGGGGDAEEHHLDAVESLLHRVPWTADPSRARGAIIGFTTADTKPARSGISAAALGREINEKGILLYLVCEPTATLQELAAAAGGLVFQISNSPDPADMQRIASQLAASIVATVASGATVPMSVPA
jgi:hypothetical protein